MLLIKLCGEGTRGKIQQLVEQHGVDVDCKNGASETPLYTAALNLHLQVIEYLLSKKANVNCKTKFHFTPLHAAVFPGDFDCVAMLVEHGAQVDAVNRFGKTPLTIVKEARDENKITELTKKKLDKILAYLLLAGTMLGLID